MNVSLESKIVPHPQVVAQRLPDEAVLLLPAKGEVKVLNEVGACIWSALDGKRTVADVVALVCSEYDVDHEQAAQDTLAFVGELLHRQMVLLVA